MILRNNPLMLERIVVEPIEFKDGKTKRRERRAKKRK
jgi:hypothetical protein